MTVQGSIPASQVADVQPNVLSAGGSALDVIGLFLTTSGFVPIGAVEPFASPSDVEAYFGSVSTEATAAANYFEGYDNAPVMPDSLLFAQYPASAVAAWIRGGNISGLPLASLQAINGTLILTVDGSEQTASINLSGAASFSAAATLIQTALNTATAATGSVAANVMVGRIDPNVVTGGISGTTLTVSGVTTGALAPGQTIMGTGIEPGTTIVAQLTGSPLGGTGTYQLSQSQVVPGSTVITASGGCLNVSAVTTGTVAVGQTITVGATSGTKVTYAITGTGGTGKYAVDTSQTVAPSTSFTFSGGTLNISAVSAGSFGLGDVFTGTNVSANNTITAFLTGTGNTGTYLCSIGDTASSTAISVAGANVTVSYGSVQGAFKIFSGTTGTSSTMTYATGTTAASLLLTQATGAVTSQGAAATDPVTFMDGVIDVTQNWVTFTSLFDPDNGSGHTNKLAFASWTNAQNDSFAYVAWDTDITPTNTVPATTSFGYALTQAGYSGTIPIYGPDYTIAAMVCGSAASVDYSLTNGRINFKFRTQSGLSPSATNGTVASNLAANGYNFYGGYATRNANFNFFANGTISGPFNWIDSYINQIVFNNELQSSILTGLTQVGSVPYNSAGYSTIEAFCTTPINNALNFGTIRPGVTLSASQISDINNAAGANVAGVVSTRGWYLQVKDASPTVRAQRGSPPCVLWYSDGESVNKISLDSVLVQ